MGNQIGCGKVIIGVCMPYDNGEAVALPVQCGAYLGDEGEYYCEACQELIDNLQEDEV